jgi:phosphoribosylformylglycinamidine synthase
MVAPRVLILRAPGTNCDQETAHAFALAGGEPTVRHLNELLAAPWRLDEYQILCLPGGFSFGDDLGAGRIFAHQLNRNLGGRLGDFREAGKLILGICNGFQVLVQTGLLPDASAVPAPPEGRTRLATLALNDCGRFQCRWVRLVHDASRSVFFQGIDEMLLPVAHAEGRFAVAAPGILDALVQKRMAALRYAPLDGSDQRPCPFPDNPNGAEGDVAGLCDATGRVAGLMPHPERHVSRLQHPQRTRMADRSDGPGDGLAVFQNAVRYFQ